MKGLSFTISKKLFLIFLANSLIILTISGLVLQSFSGLSGQFNHNSQLLNYKITLDAIRVEQAKLKGQAQSFYLNVTEETIRDGLGSMNASLDLILKYLEDLSHEQNQRINELSLESQHRFRVSGSQPGFQAQDSPTGLEPEAIVQRGFIYNFEKAKLGHSDDPSLSEKLVSTITSDWFLIKKELEQLKGNVNLIADNAAKQISTLAIAKKNLSNLGKSREALQGRQERITALLQDQSGTGSLDDQWFEQLSLMATKLEEMLSGQAVFKQERESGLAVEFASEFAVTALPSKVYLQDLITEYDALFKGLEPLVLDAQDDELEDALYDFDDFFRNTHKSVNRIGQEYLTSEVFAAQFSDNNLRVASILEDINALIFTDLNEVNHSVTERANRFLVIVLVISSVGLLVGLFFWFLVQRSITRPVNALVDTSKDIAQGEADLTKRIAVHGRDELSELSTWFNLFLERLYTLVLKVKENASSISSSTQDIVRGTEDLSSRTLQQSTSLEETATSMEQINSIVQNNARETVRANEITKQAEGTVDEYREQLLETVGKTVEANQTLVNTLEATNRSIVDKSQGAQDTATHSKTQLLETIENTIVLNKQMLDSFALTNQNVFEAMERIAESSNKIVGITSLMNDIAFQTNLLSLNASVEAARAGEHGKGFAVVATEVRKLAMRSAKASKQIDHLIKTSLEDIQLGQKTVSEGKEGLGQSKQEIDAMLKKLQSDSNVNLEEITLAFEAVSKLIQEGEEQMNRMKNDIESMLNHLQTNSDFNLEQILGSFKNVSEVMGEIKIASEEQATGVEQINNSILEMDRITQENAQYAANNIEISQTTAEQALHLETLMQAFKVNSDAPSLASPEKKRIELDSEKRKPTGSQPEEPRSEAVRRNDPFE